MNRSNVIHMAYMARLHETGVVGEYPNVEKRLMRLAQLLIGAVIPPGWQVVPKSPTNWMVAAGVEAWHDSEDGDTENDVRREWAEMLRIAPCPCCLLDTEGDAE